MSPSPEIDPAADQHLTRFAELVESVGVKRFAMSLGISTRQVNRMLAGSQPNPVDRLIRSLQAAEPETGDRVLDHVCAELGGHFVRHESVDAAAVNAVRECAEAIAAISDGSISDVDVTEVREAISALSSLILALHRGRDGSSGDSGTSGASG